jgi:hypothetical protein
MAYREAKTDREKKRGKSTDELSFEEAKAFFSKKGKDKGSTKFRWRGDVYTTGGKKVGGGSKAKETTSTRSSSAPSESKRPKARPESKPTTRPKARQTGRGDGIAEMARRALDKPAPIRVRQEDTEDNRTTPIRSPDRKPTSIAESVSQKRSRAKQVLSERASTEAATRARQESVPSFSSYMNEKRREDPDAFRSDPSGFRRKVREMYDTTYGFNKGGMVRKGNTNYKDKGMFYKSASPKGFK